MICSDGSTLDRTSCERFGFDSDYKIRQDIEVHIRFKKKPSRASHQAFMLDVLGGEATATTKLLKRIAQPTCDAFKHESCLWG